MAKLTEREREVLQLVANGLTNKEISDTLSTFENPISERTVSRHLESITLKLLVDNRTHAVATGLREGLIN